MKMNRVNFDRINFFACSHQAPVLISFTGIKETILFMDRMGPVFDALNRPTNIGDLLEFSTLAASTRYDFTGRSLLNRTSNFSFLFDNRSGYFMLADANAKMSPLTLSGGFYVLKTLNKIDVDFNNLACGTLHTDRFGEITTVHASPYDHRITDKRDMKQLFTRLAYGIIRIGCNKKITVLDETPFNYSPVVTFIRTQNQIFGDFLEMVSR